MKKNTIERIYGILMCVIGVVGVLCVGFRMFEILETAAVLAAIVTTVVGVGMALVIGTFFIYEGICTFMDMWYDRRGNESRN